VRTIIDGMAYDTDTAKFIARGDYRHPMSDASWWLYRTPNGAFFEVYYGHDGAPEEVNPFTDEQAHRFLEKNANHLVEEYFGPMPEASPPSLMRFSRRTVIAAIEVFERLNHAELTRFVLKLGPEFPRWVGSPSLSIANRLNNLIEIVDQWPDRPLDDGQLLRDVLIEAAVGLLPPVDPEHPWSEYEEYSPMHARAGALLRALNRDGFTVFEGKLRRELPIDIDLPTTQSEVDRLLDKHGFAVPKGQLVQAIDAHARGNWAGANGQFRPFFEGLLDEIAGKVASGLGDSIRRLIAVKFLSSDLNERDFIQGLMKRLHAHGPHPGLSGEGDSTYRFHLVLLTAHLLLTRLDAWERP